MMRSDLVRGVFVWVAVLFSVLSFCQPMPGEPGGGPWQKTVTVTGTYSVEDESDFRANQSGPITSLPFSIERFMMSPQPAYAIKIEAEATVTTTYKWVGNPAQQPDKIILLVTGYAEAVGNPNPIYTDLKNGLGDEIEEYANSPFFTSYGPLYKSYRSEGVRYRVFSLDSNGEVQFEMALKADSRVVAGGGPDTVVGVRLSGGASISSAAVDIVDSHEITYRREEALNPSGQLWGYAVPNQTEPWGRRVDIGATREFFLGIWPYWDVSGSAVGSLWGYWTNPPVDTFWGTKFQLHTFDIEGDVLDLNLDWVHADYYGYNLGKKGVTYGGGWDELSWPFDTVKRAQFKYVVSDSITGLTADMLLDVYFHQPIENVRAIKTFVGPFHEATNPVFANSDPDFTHVASKYEPVLLGVTAVNYGSTPINATFTVSGSVAFTLGWEHTKGFALGLDLPEFLSTKVQSSMSVSSESTLTVGSTYTLEHQVPSESMVLIYGGAAGHVYKKQMARYGSSGFLMDSEEIATQGGFTLIFRVIPVGGEL